jgi:hypothetical protein
MQKLSVLDHKRITKMSALGGLYRNFMQSALATNCGSVVRFEPVHVGTIMSPDKSTVAAH